jgi:hypothetical protein
MYHEDQSLPVVRIHCGGRNSNSTARSDRLFIRGPIPMDWIAAAAGLPGKTLNAALALWWLSGMKDHSEFKVTRQALALLQISDDAYRDALSRLEQARLVTVQRRPGQRALVKINRSVQAHQGLGASTG